MDSDGTPNRSKIFTTKLVIIVAAVAVGIIVGITWKSSFAVGTGDQYISMSTLDSNLTADQYFPHGPNTVRVGDEMHWNIAVFNHMGGSEYVAVRARLLDSSQAAPNDTTHTPAIGRMVLEKRTVIANNSTAIIPFDWSIQRAPAGSTGFSGLVIDDQRIPGFIAKEGNLRMVIELWRYDNAHSDFSFSWPYGSGTKDVWNEVWFSIET